MQRGGAGIRQAAALPLLLAAASLLAAGCHDVRTPGSPGSEAPTQTGGSGPAPVVRLPVQPGESTLPAGPAILDTVEPYPVPLDALQVPSQPVVLPLDDQRQLTWQVPETWTIDEQRPRARSFGREVRAEATITAVGEQGLTLAGYLRVLVEGDTIYSYVTPSGYAVYVISREVSVAPSDPAAPRSMFHTAVLDIGGRIAKVEVTYDSRVRWRFEGLATEILATIDVEQVPLAIDGGPGDALATPDLVR